MKAEAAEKRKRDEPLTPRMTLKEHIDFFSVELQEEKKT